MNGLSKTHPILRTLRLEVHPWSESQGAEFLELTRDEGFRAHPITDYRQADIETARRWAREQGERFARTGLGKYAVRERVGGALVGMGGLTPWEWEGERLVDLTYRFRESAWGRGYGTEVARAITAHAFGALGLPEITATITPDNGPSLRIAARLGMRLDRRIVLLGVPTELYRLSRGEWRD